MSASSKTAASPARSKPAAAAALASTGATAAAQPQRPLLPVPTRPGKSSTTRTPAPDGNLPSRVILPSLSAVAAATAGSSHLLRHHQQQPQHQPHTRPSPSSSKTSSGPLPGYSMQVAPLHDQHPYQHAAGRSILPHAPSLFAGTPYLPSSAMGLGGGRETRPFDALAAVSQIAGRGPAPHTESLTSAHQHGAQQQRGGPAYPLVQSPSTTTPMQSSMAPIPSMISAQSPAAAAPFTVLLPFLATAAGTTTAQPSLSSEPSSLPLWIQTLPTTTTTTPTAKTTTPPHSGTAVWPFLSAPSTHASSLPLNPALSAYAAGSSGGSGRGNPPATFHPPLDGVPGWPSIPQMIWAVVHMMGEKVAVLAQRGLTGTITNEEKSQLMTCITELMTCAAVLELPAPAVVQPPPPPLSSLAEMSAAAASGGIKRKASSPEIDSVSSSTTSSASPRRSPKRDLGAEEGVSSSASPPTSSPSSTGAVPPAHKKSRMLSISSIINETEPSHQKHQHQHLQDNAAGAETLRRSTNSLRSVVDEEEDGAVGLSMLRDASLVRADSRGALRSSSSGEAHPVARKPRSSSDPLGRPSTSSPSSPSSTSPTLSLALAGAKRPKPEPQTSPTGSARPASSPPSSSSPSSPLERSPSHQGQRQSPERKSKKSNRRRKQCAHCSTVNSSVWRRGYDNVILCNACGLRWARNKRKSGIEDESSARRTRGPRVSRKGAKKLKYDEEDDDEEEGSWGEEDSEDELWMGDEDDDDGEQHAGDDVDTNGGGVSAAPAVRHA